MPGTLFVVATPIGNLEDITLRALRILGEVAVVAAEDTRRSGNLLRHYGITTPLISLHEHNEYGRSPQLVERLLAGESIALVSDAGTPGISDPGATLVRAARTAGIRVEAIPGASAVTAALSASGLALDRFAFAGFPPTRSKDRKIWLQWVQRLPDTVIVCFEAPHRIRRTIEELRSNLVNRPIMLARELTKTHEEWVVDASAPHERGEFVILIGQLTESEVSHGRTAVGEEMSTSSTSGQAGLAAAVACNTAVRTPTDAAIAKMFGDMTKSDEFPTRRAAIKALAERLGLPTKSVYAALERAKN